MYGLCRRSEQAGDLAVDIHQCPSQRVLGQAGHRHDAAADHDHESGTGRESNLTHIQRKALGRTGQLGIVAEGILRFGDADRQIAVALRGQLVQRLFAAAV